MKEENQAPIHRLLQVMDHLRSPEGCPWDREQDHMSLRFHAVEEVYELMDAIEAGDEKGMIEELGDLLLQVVFHCCLGQERNAFDFNQVCRRLIDKIIYRHPHVFGQSKAKTIDAVWAQWERLKKAEKQGGAGKRDSALDGIPRHLPALLYAEKLIGKARKSGLLHSEDADSASDNGSTLGEQLFHIVQSAQQRGLSAEALLRETIQQREELWRAKEGKTTV